MRKYSREMIAQILAANDIVEVIGGYLDLKPSGMHRYKALSPFTNEKTPSFMVSRDRQMYHCFSSGRGGDAISFLMEHEGLSFNEALQKLADRAGIKLESSGVDNDREASLRKRVLEINAFAAKFYRRFLTDTTSGAYGRDYLKKRGLRESTETRFNLGLAAANEWTMFFETALKQKFSEYEILASGLVRKGDRTLYDFFRNRLIVPIKDVSGNVVAFGGRDLGDSPAKYINSPETAAYKKSRVLYGLHEARDAMRREQRALLVEGYFDLMRCFDAGIENVVATCGTALTEQQAMLIKRYAPEVVVVYDGDEAGIRAAIKSIGILTAAGLGVHALTLPDAKDPDDYIRDTGAEAFRERIAAAPDFVSFYMAMSGAKKDTIEGRTEIAHELFAIIRALDEPIRVEQYLKRIADGLGIHPWDCKRDFERYCKNRRRPVAPVELQRDTEKTTPLKDDVDFIAALIAYPSLHGSVISELTDLPSQGAVQALAMRISEDGIRLALHDLDDDDQCILYSAAGNIDVPDTVKAHQVVSERINRFKYDAWQQELQELQEQARRAGLDKDNKRSAELFNRILNVKQRLEQLGAA